MENIVYTRLKSNNNLIEPKEGTKQPGREKREGEGKESGPKVKSGRIAWLEGDRSKKGPLKDKLTL